MISLFSGKGFLECVIGSELQSPPALTDLASCQLRDYQSGRKFIPSPRRISAQAAGFFFSTIQVGSRGPLHLVV